PRFRCTACRPSVRLQDRAHIVTTSSKTPTGCCLLPTLPPTTRTTGGSPQKKRWTSPGPVRGGARGHELQDCIGLEAFLACNKLDPAERTLRSEGASAAFFKHVGWSAACFHPRLRVDIAGSSSVRPSADWPPPHEPPLHEHGRDHLRLQRHATSALGRQLVFSEKVADPTEGEVTAFEAVEAHAAETDLRGAGPLLGRHDLIRRERHPANRSSCHTSGSSTPSGSARGPRGPRGARSSATIDRA